MNSGFYTKALFAILLSSTFWMISCEKTERNIPPLTTSEVSDLFKTYTVFDTNSYWVYQNMQNQLTDSISITDFYTERRFHSPINQNPGFYYNAYEILFQSGEIGLIRGEVTGGYSTDFKDSLPENYRIYFDNGRYFSILTPQYPLGEEQLLGINEGNYTNEAFHSTYELNGNTFTNVFQVRVKDYQQAPDTVLMRFFMAKNVGLIRYFRQSENRTDDWVLSRWDAKPVPENPKKNPVHKNRVSF
jgi:hypothetical protein